MTDPRRPHPDEDKDASEDTLASAGSQRGDRRHRTTPVSSSSRKKPEHDTTVPPSRQETRPSGNVPPAGDDTLPAREPGPTDRYAETLPARGQPAAPSGDETLPAHGQPSSPRGDETLPAPPAGPAPADETLPAPGSGPAPADETLPAPGNPSASADETLAAPADGTLPTGGPPQGSPEDTLAAPPHPSPPGGSKTLGTAAADTVAAGAGPAEAVGRGEGSSGHHRSLASGAHQTYATMRTRANPQLSKEMQPVDHSLQLSRRSVYTDMATIRPPGSVPPMVQQRVDNADTDGRYVVDKELAKGGMGAVLAVADHDFQRDTAMKVMHAQFAGDPALLERFLEEAQVTAQLEHPNIVPIHDVGVMPDGTLYYTMKMIRGMSFGDVVKQLKAGDEAAQAKWTQDHMLLAFLKILDGVGYANARGVVHRDLKPDNVMVEEHGEVLVVDWGLAKVLNAAHSSDDQLAVRGLRDEHAASHTMAGSVMGTPYYMPPEQATGDLEAIDARSDVYALGATLYELLCYEKPFPKCSMQELLMKVQAGDFTGLDQAAPELHQDLIAIVHKAMALRPENRYETCEAFAADLRSFLAGQAVAARKRNLIERFGAWVQAHKTQMLVAAAMIVVLIGGAMAATQWQRAEREQRIADIVASVADDLAAEAATPEARLDDLQEAEDALNQAKGLDAQHPRVVALEKDLAKELGVVEGEVARRAQREADQIRARQLLTDAEAEHESGDYQAAAELLAAALRLQITDDDLRAAILAQRDEAAAALADERRAGQIRAANQAFAQARSRLADAQARMQEVPDLDEPAIIAREGDVQELLAAGEAAQQHLQAVARQLDQAQQDGYAPEGFTGVANQSAALSERLQDRLTTARSLAERYATARGLQQQAQQALERGDLALAQQRASAALELLSSDSGIARLYQRVLSAQAQAEAARVAEKTRQERIDLARRTLDQAQQHREAWQQALERVETIDQRIQNLEQRLAGEPLDQKKELYSAHDDLQAAQVEAVEMWTATETAAGQVLRLLRDEPNHEARAEARRLLADVNAALLAHAEAANDLTGQLVYRDKVRQYDEEGRYLPATDAPATVDVQGSGSFTLARVERRDARFQAQMAAQVLQDVPTSLELEPGRWQLSGAFGIVTIHVEPGEQRILTLPGEPPAIRLPTMAADLPLAWVPNADGSGGLWMSTTEITHTAYAVFVNQPARFKQIGYEIATMLAEQKARAIPFLPTWSGSVTFANNQNEMQKPSALIHAETNAYRGFAVPAAYADMPVTGITRADARAFCDWAGEIGGQTVRLPTLSEWRRAARLEDPDRYWPWGPVFDPAFTVLYRQGRSGPEPVGSTPADIGPCGHRDLAGNVREWVADSDGPLLGGYDAIVAGGGWSDADQEQASTGAYEAVNAQAANNAIGFRIVVEAE